jgi:hypothetical protein
MSVGTYQPIVPWDLEAFRSGALPYQEAATFAAVYGAPCVINSAGQLAEAGTAFTQAAVILAKTGANAAAAGTLNQGYRIRTDIVWEVTLNEAFALNQIGKSYGLVKDATTKNWYLSTADTGNQMVILDQHPLTAVGDTKSRVLAAFNPNAIQALGANQQIVGVISASGAVTANQEGTYSVTKAGVAALTLAAPTAGVDDGKIIRLTSTTANAHTLTATGLLNTGSASVNVATFAAFAGAGLSLMALNAKWQVLSQIGITFS